MRVIGTDGDDGGREGQEVVVGDGKRDSVEISDVYVPSFSIHFQMPICQGFIGKHQ